MNISFDADRFLSEEQYEKLKQSLRSYDENRLSEEQLTERLTRIAQSAFAEYIEMILGTHLPTKANEFRERRLYHLLHHYFEDLVPTEGEVLTMFQLTESGSRTLLRNVRAKYKYELQEIINRTVRSVLSEPRLSGDDFRFVIRSENVLEEIKLTISTIAPHLDQVQKVKNSAGVFRIPEDTYRELCHHYDLDFEALRSEASS